MIKFRSLLVALPLFFLVSSCNYLHIDAFTGSTLIWESGSNNYFNRDKPHDLAFPTRILVTGEVERDVYVKIDKLPWHSVTVKEAIPDGDSVAFFGAFRYDGFALSDILSTVKVDKWSKESFYPPVDLYVEVWNDKGEHVVFSWGEIFYSADVYKIILARSVTRVIPGKTGEMWNLPRNSKIVAGFDHYSVRNIENPVKIVIRSLRGNFIVDRDPEIFRSDSLLIYNGEKRLAVLDPALYLNASLTEQKTMFYGQSMGNKGEKVYRGFNLGQILDSAYTGAPGTLAGKIVCIEGTDGYRASFSLSELINRNDHREPLLVYGEQEEGRVGFSVFCSSDMFADRAIKSVSKITIN